MITRDRVMDNARDGFGDGLGTTPYSQDVLKDGYRTDCSGYVSRCWQLTDAWGHGFWGGLNTVTLVSAGAMVEIDPDDLRAGDACGHCGPGTGGDAGHIVLFDRWQTTDNDADNRHWIYEQAGGTLGPTHRMIDWPYPGFSWSQWRAYRFVNIEGAGPHTMYTSVGAHDVSVAAHTWKAVQFTDCFANTGGFWTPPHGGEAGYSVATGPLLFAGDIRLKTHVPDGAELHFRFVETAIHDGDGTVTKKHPVTEVRRGLGDDYVHATTVSELNAKQHLWVQLWCSAPVSVPRVGCKVMLLPV